MKRFANSLFSLLLLTHLFMSCNNSQGSNGLESTSNQLAEFINSSEYELNSSIKDSLEPKIEVISEIEQSLIDAGLVNIQDVDPSIFVDVRYATENNFMRRVVYEGYDKVYLQPVIAERLSKAQNALKAIDSSLSLKVFDGTRPRFVQQQMWDAMDTIPVRERTKFLSNPKNGSVHNYGCAVDLTIIHKETGEELDMGAGYDDLRKIAYPRHEAHFLSTGELTAEHVENRKLLRQVMKAGGFWVIETEWWHFNGFTRNKAKELFEIVE